MTENGREKGGIGRSVGRVVVVGAGFAGLSAASELARAGCSVTVLERGSTAGGRCGGEQEDGFSIDQRLPLLYSGDQRLASWIRDLGLAQALLPPRPVQIAQLSSGGVVPIDAVSPRSVARIPGVKWREALRLIRLPRLMNRYRSLLDLESPELAADLDYRSAADFGRLYFGQTVVDRFIADLRACDFLGRRLDVRENVKFQGGHFSRWVHQTYPESGCALAIEFKKFFMDEWTGVVDEAALSALVSSWSRVATGLRASFESLL